MTVTFADWLKPANPVAMTILLMLTHTAEQQMQKLMAHQQPVNASLAGWLAHFAEQPLLMLKGRQQPVTVTLAG